MRISVERLRVWLVVGATFLALVIAGFLGYARYRTHRFLAGLPARLGVDIRRETNGYTLSKSVGPNTTMTLHASRAVEHKDGKLTLHDVSMVLYGRKQNRADRISGSEFEYEEATGVVRAVGEVHIDLQAPAGEGTGKKESVPTILGDQPEQESKRIIHVKTSGLVFLQKLGVAATDQGLEFKFGGITGHATGAEYNSDTGIVILQSAVKANGLQHGRPVVLLASHAELERQNQRALLTDAKYVSPGQAARGDHAIVHLRSDGSLERIEGEGNVTLEASATGSVTAPHADLLLNAASQAQKAHFFGGVAYRDVSSLREGTGQAQDAQLTFDPRGQPENVLLNGSVHVSERTRSTSAVAWSTREATAGRMTFALVSEPGSQRKELRTVEAASTAHVTLVSEAGTAASARSELSGDLLRGAFTGAGRTAELSSIHGGGHTALRRIGAAGAEQTSAGDTLDATLRPASKTAGGEQIEKATQLGHVILASRPAAKPGDKAPPATTSAVSDLAVYDGDADHLTLTGHAQIVSEADTVSANKIVIEHTSGDATAEGAVKANYSQPDATEPVHVFADHAELQHDAQRALFYGASDRGAPTRPVRLWQGASQVEAPILELDQQQRTLTARGVPSATGAPPVHAVLVGNSSQKSPNPTAPKPLPASPSVVRIASGSMIYRDATRQVDFTGGVKVEDVDGVLHAQQATAFLQPAPAGSVAASKKDTPKSASSGAFFGGSVERIVASGSIEMDQPGRRAAGEQLVYTAADGIFVLTGTAAAPPRLTDEVQGTVTGTALRFRTGDDGVMVTGGSLNNPSQRVHTVTRVKQK